jgi:Flp pilus assembly protein TadB
MSQNSSSNSGGIGLYGLLTVAFIVLKLCNVIAWSWVWVLAPLWIPAAIALVIIVICLLIWLIDHK